MKYTLKIFVLACLLLPNWLLAEIILTLELSPAVQSAQIFYVGDFNFTQTGSAPNIFNLRINNDGDSAERISIRFNMTWNNEIVADAQTNIFEMPAHNEVTINYQDLNAGAAIILNSQGAPQRIEFDRNDFNFNELQNQVIATGKLPSGTYVFRLEAVPENNPGAVVNSAVQTITITNPTTLEPLYPGNRVSEKMLIEVPTPFPNFLWQSDAQLFDLFVYEKYAEDESIQDVLSHDPMLHIENYPNQVFQYPADPSPLTFDLTGGGSVGPIRLLEPGHIYYWYVQAIIPASSGNVDLNSDVYQFKLTDSQQDLSNSNLILVYLRQILGDRYEQYMSALQGYEPDGTILLNKTPVDPETLIEFITKINQNKIDIQSIHID